MEGLEREKHPHSLDEPLVQLVAAALGERINTPVSQPYVLLSTSQDEFRLIELLPSPSFDTPIVCQLIDVTFRSPPKYEALSYVCGSPHFISPIKLSTSPILSVGENLELALWYLRFPSEKRILCVDALADKSTDTE